MQFVVVNLKDQFVLLLVSIGWFFYDATSVRHRPSLATTPMASAFSSRDVRPSVTLPLWRRNRCKRNCRSRRRSSICWSSRSSCAQTSCRPAQPNASNSNRRSVSCRRSTSDRRPARTARKARIAASRTPPWATTRPCPNRLKWLVSCCFLLTEVRFMRFFLQVICNRH